MTITISQFVMGIIFTVAMEFTVLVVVTIVQRRKSK